jgi:hypothetical protein
MIQLRVFDSTGFEHVVRGFVGDGDLRPAGKSHINQVAKSFTRNIESDCAEVVGHAATLPRKASLGELHPEHFRRTPARRNGAAQAGQTTWAGFCLTFLWRSYSDGNEAK